MIPKAEPQFPAIPLAPPGFKSGFVAIVGRPNVGKSTLMNRLVGQKIAITSPVAQTTRNRLQGILTADRSQLIFVDTPGIHKPHHELGRVLVQNARSAIHAVDLVLFVLDGSVPMGGGDRYVASLLEGRPTPVIAGINKSDCPAARDSDIRASYAPILDRYGAGVFYISALTGEGLEKLQSYLTDCLDEGPYYYPPGLVTDRPERFIMGELIREQILLLTRQEIPHSVAIAIERVEESPECTSVYAAITVERDSQKGILIGKRGSMLKAIGSAARQQIQKLIDGEVFLKLFVKVEPNWRQSRLQLRDLGYRLED